MGLSEKKWILLKIAWNSPGIVTNESWISCIKLVLTHIWFVFQGKESAPYWGPPTALCLLWLGIQTYCRLRSVPVLVMLISFFHRTIWRWVHIFCGPAASKQVYTTRHGQGNSFLVKYNLRVRRGAQKYKSEECKSVPVIIPLVRKSDAVVWLHIMYNNVDIMRPLPRRSNPAALARSRASCSWPLDLARASPPLRGVKIYPTK